MHSLSHREWADLIGCGLRLTQTARIRWMHWYIRPGLNGSVWLPFRGYLKSRFCRRFWRVRDMSIRAR